MRSKEKKDTCVAGDVSFLGGYEVRRVPAFLANNHSEDGTVNLSPENKAS